MLEKKTCTKCRKVLSRTNFHNDKSTKDGLRCWCKACCAESQRAYVKNNQALVREKKQKYNKEYWRKNREALSERNRQYYQRNKDTLNAANAEYRIQHADEIKFYEENRKISQVRLVYKSNYQREYRAKNPNAYNKWRIRHTGTYNQSRAKRRAAKIHATPEWRDQEKIRKVYNKCALRNKDDCGRIIWTVDHFVPLQGKFVSGLHVHDNLDIMTLTENSSKSNKWNP